MKLLNIARVAFKDNTQATKELQLEGNRETKFDRWETQCNFFFHGLSDNTTYQTAINRYIPQTEITAAAADFNHVLELHEIYVLASGEAQKASEILKSSVRTLKTWKTDFQKIAKVAYADSPQNLEKLGIKA